MASKVVDGILYKAPSNDHEPCHVHALLSEACVIIELHAGKAKVADRPDAIRPGNAKKNDIRKAIKTAQKHYSTLHKLWETTDAKR